MKNFISWVVGVGILTGVGSAFASADLVDGVCDELLLSYNRESNNIEKALNYLAAASNNAEKALNYLAEASNNDACDEYGYFFSKEKI